jgi:hypothetical protein
MRPSCLGETDLAVLFRRTLRMFASGTGGTVNLLTATIAQLTSRTMMQVGFCVPESASLVRLISNSPMVEHVGEFLLP